MKIFEKTNTAIITTIFGVAFMTGAVLSVAAQNPTNEYRQWQTAQQRATREHNDYLRTHSNRDYRQWQIAQQRAAKEYRDYQRATANYNNRWNDPRYERRSNNRRYRVYNNGSTYWTDYRGAELLKAAVNNGYRQGYRQGQIDRARHRRYSYLNDRSYRNGTNGYRSYVERNQYQYYFREGFRRGYEDGYYSRANYGYRSGNAFNIFSGVLNGILNLVED